MEIWAAFNALRLAVCLLELMSVPNLGGCVDRLRQRTESTDPLTQAGASVQCTLQVTPRASAFSKDGDFVIGGIFSIHYQLYTVINNYTTKPEPPRCTGRLVWRSGEVNHRNVEFCCIYLFIFAIACCILEKDLHFFFVVIMNALLAINRTFVTSNNRGLI